MGCGDSRGAAIHSERAASAPRSAHADLTDRRWNAKTVSGSPLRRIYTLLPPPSTSVRISRGRRQRVGSWYRRPPIGQHSFLFANELLSSKQPDAALHFFKRLIERLTTSWKGLIAYIV